MTRALLACLAATTLCLAACTLPPRPSLPSTYALSTPEQTALYQSAAAALPTDGRSGFALLPIASYAFDARLALTEKAQRTLDVQYYLFKGDQTGRRLMRALAQAALRGVRVRLLIDDLYSTGEDQVLSHLDRIPNVEVRLFNPFAAGRDHNWLRLLGASLDLERIDWRMHNKLFIADNALALAGGRNIGDEYFMNSLDSNFVDIDLFVAGPAVADLSSAFDRYRNSDRAYPLASLTAEEPDLLEAQRAFMRETDDAKAPPQDVLTEELRRFGTLPDEIRASHISALVVGAAHVVADDPDKPQSVDDPSVPTVTRQVLAKVALAEQSVDIVSPYFVPGKRGMRMMDQAAEKHGVTRVFTNSLASTDAPLAAYGYMKYRKAMLDDHVLLYEMSPTLTRDRGRLGFFKRSLGSLHAKCVVIDQRLIFLGSMNLDGRSAYQNTEVGLIIDSPELIASIEGLLDVDSFYQLRLNASDDIEWVAHTGPDGALTVYLDAP